MRHNVTLAHCSMVIYLDPKCSSSCMQHTLPPVMRKKKIWKFTQAQTATVQVFVDFYCSEFSWNIFFFWIHEKSFTLSFCCRTTVRLRKKPAAYCLVRLVYKKKKFMLPTIITCAAYIQVHFKHQKWQYVIITADQELSNRYRSLKLLYIPMFKNFAIFMVEVKKYNNVSVGGWGLNMSDYRFKCWKEIFSLFPFTWKNFSISFWIASRSTKNVLHLKFIWIRERK